MAEAAVGERTSPPNRFYCHTCKLEISIFNNDYTCPLCSGGFIEELPPPSPGSDTTSSASGSSSFMGPEQIDIELQPHYPNIRLDGLLASTLRARRMAYENARGNSNDPNTGSSGSTGGRRGARTNNGNASGRQQQPNFHGLDDVFLDLITSLSGGDDNVFGNSQMFFMGNPADYAWGREGIDTVVTQLLNHMDISGPPPLPKEKIADIPTVPITEAEVSQKLKCSVCWEDFQLQEAVRKLPCLHVYHENCIVPWLDLHGTCPICRKSLQIEPSTSSCSMQNGADYTSSPTATVSVTVTTPDPCTSFAANRIDANILNQLDNNTSSTQQAAIPPQPQPPPPPSATAAASLTQVNPQSTAQAQQQQAPGRSSQSINYLAYDDGNIEYDFD